MKPGRSTPEEAHQSARGAAWSAHLLREQPEECAVRSREPQDRRDRSPAESGGLSRPKRLIPRLRIRSKTPPVRLVIPWRIAAGQVGSAV
jgi:hypothetical protein